MVETKNIFGKENIKKDDTNNELSKGKMVMKVVLIDLILMTLLSLSSLVIYIINKIELNSLIKINLGGVACMFILGLAAIFLISASYNERRSWEITKKYLNK